MDPALLKDREAFKKRALYNPVIENKKRERESPLDVLRKKVKASSQKPKSSEFSYKTSAGTSTHNFSVLAKIVKHMKQRHLDGDTYPLTIDEILDETNQLDIGSRQRHWLTTEALVNNPKIEITTDGKYVFKPTFNIRDRKGLLRLLDKHDQRGLGGIFYDDAQESLPNMEKALKILGDGVFTITQPISKKKVLFYNDKAVQLNMDEEFRKLYRSVAVDGLDENKIEEYLQKQGITSMQDMGVKKITPVQKRKKASNKNRNFKKLNQHMSDVLQDYTEN